MFEASSARPHGTIIVDGQPVAETKQCCHCGSHFEIIKGSGRLRGFCRFCNQVTCGSHRCMSCMPLEKRLDLFEKGKLDASEL
jgi:hypothetical protein